MYSTPPCPPLATRTSSQGCARSANIFPRLLFTTVPVTFINTIKLNSSEAFTISLAKKKKKKNQNPNNLKCQQPQNIQD